MTFDQIYIPEGADEAMEWAATQEFEMRYRRMERSRLGFTGALKKATATINRFNVILAGDPSAPEGKKVQ